MLVSDGFISKLDTTTYPEIVPAFNTTGIFTFIDDCDCNDCVESRNLYLDGTTMILAINNEESAMFVRLLPEELRELANEMLKYASEIEELQEQLPDHVEQ